MSDLKQIQALLKRNFHGRPFCAIPYAKGMMESLDV